MRKPDADDLKWAWVAYMKGAFPGLPVGLEGDDFKVGLRTWVMAHLAAFLPGACPGYETYFIIAHHDLGEVTPVGMVVAGTDGYKLWPRVVWFPWASNRNRLEGSVRWLHEARKRLMPVMLVPTSEQRFMRHLARYGVIREIGALSDWYQPGVGGWAYQGQRLADG